MDLLVRLCDDFGLGGGRAERGDEGLRASKLYAYVNMKASLVFSDLAVGAAIPVYTE
jgi:hypothetical protein